MLLSSAVAPLKLFIPRNQQYIKKPVGILIL